MNNIMSVLLRCFTLTGSRHSSVGMATGWMTEEPRPDSRQFYFQNGAHQASFLNGREGSALSPGVKRPEHEIEHHLPLMSRIGMRGAILPLPNTQS
jgi:hypothetical protein